MKMMFINRLIEPEILKSLKYFPVTAIVGPRQCGKSTLAKHILSNISDSIYMDLERPSDMEMLANAELFLSSQKGKLICMDEIQRVPELFPLIRSLSDEWQRPGSFLLLGSASGDLLKQSSESLAGRISYHRMTPFLPEEISGVRDFETYFTRGAFPGSLLAEDADISFIWRENFILTFLERDIAQWSGASPVSIRRLWQMLAHENGQTVNYSRLAGAHGVSDHTIKNYIDLLSGTYMLESIQPFYSNLGKRLIKAPKIYVADSGITATLLGLRTFEAILGHPGYGAMWEQVVLSALRGRFPSSEIFFYRSAGGAEIDFVLSTGTGNYAIECKASHQPSVSKGFYSAADDIRPEHSYVVIPGQKSWPLSESVDVVSLEKLLDMLERKIRPSHV
jgi:predicted AAA+ superfamily ATPase